MIGRTNTGGGGGGMGGAGINFRVFGGASAPSNPKFNDIWVKTDTDILAFYISNTEPDHKDSGVLWIVTGEPYTVEFNALKKNGLMVCPIAAQQRIDGAWKSLDGYIFGSEWVQFGIEWDGYLFKNGNQYESITGGWSSEEWNSKGTAAVSGELSVSSNNAAAPAIIGTKKPIDLTNVYAIHYNSPNGRKGNAYGGYIYICTEQNYATNVASASLYHSGSGSIDVSKLTGNHYVCLYALGGYNGYGYCDADEIWTE